MTRLAVLIASFGGIGFFPFASGTVGALGGLLVYFLIPHGPLPETIAAVVSFVVGVWAGTAAEPYFGRKDPGPVVIDEVMGMLVTLYLVPMTPASVVLGFLIFRLFDIIKPYPASRFERLGGGLGIMADDAAAAIYANLTLRLALWVGAPWLG